LNWHPEQEEPEGFLEEDLAVISQQLGELDEFANLEASIIGGIRTCRGFNKISKSGKL
jgi:hypothetical protein